MVTTRPTLQHGRVIGGGVQGGQDPCCEQIAFYCTKLGYGPPLLDGKYPFHCILGQFLAL